MNSSWFGWPGAVATIPNPAPWATKPAPALIGGSGSPWANAPLPPMVALVIAATAMIRTRFMRLTSSEKRVDQVKGMDRIMEIPRDVDGPAQGVLELPPAGWQSGRRSLHRLMSARRGFEPRGQWLERPGRWLHGLRRRRSRKALATGVVIGNATGPILRRAADQVQRRQPGRWAIVRIVWNPSCQSFPSRARRAT